MSNGWQELYSELAGFITEHPEVKIGASIVRIPENVRPEFYRLFDAVRMAFIEEKFSNLLSEATTLSRNYIKVEEEVIKLLGLDGITLVADLNWFLHNPIKGLIRGLFDLLFDLLKGKASIDAFEQEALLKVESSFRNFYQPGYEKWVAFTLLKLLAADEAFNVTPQELDPDEYRLEDYDLTGAKEEAVPELTETKRLSFKHGMFPAFVTPDFIVHSAKINRYIAIRTELGNAIWRARQVSKKREWHDFRSIKKEFGSVALRPDLLISVDNEPVDIALVADFDRICRPDLIIECIEQRGPTEKERAERLKFHYNALKPRLGMYILSREPVPEEVAEALMLEKVPEEAAKEPMSEPVSGWVFNESKELALEQTAAASPEQVSGEVGQEPAPEQKPEKQEVGIRVLTVGFDESQLAPIIDLLAGNDNDTGAAQSQYGGSTR